LASPPCAGSFLWTAGEEPEQQRTEEAEQKTSDDGEVDRRVFVVPDDVAWEPAEAYMEPAEQQDQRAQQHQDDSRSDQKAS